jgi:hypothetical protein
MLLENLWLLHIGLLGRLSFDHKTNKEKPEGRNFREGLTWVVGV